MKTLEEKFWERVEKTETCWNWTSTTAYGYGRFLVGSRKYVAAHRFSFELANGPIEAGLIIDHKCHAKGCVKPSHLRVATPKQNAENQITAHRDSRTGVRGVWVTRDNKFQGQVIHNRKAHYVGRFPTLAEAEAAVIAKRNELFTHNLADRMAA